MTKYIGRNVDLGIAREATRGAGASPAYWVPKVDFNYDDKVTKARSDAGIGDISDSEEAFVTTKYGEGDVGGEVRDQSFGLFLLALFGDVSVAGPVDEAYTHSFTLDNGAQHDSLAFTVQDPNTTELYKLVMLSQLELSAELDEILKYSATFMGKQATDTQTVTTAYTAENKFTKRHLTVKFASDIASLAAATAICPKSLTLTFNQNTTMDDCLGTAEPEDFLNQQWSVEGNLTLNYEDETYKNYMKADTNRAMQISWTNTEKTIGSGSTNPSLTFQMPKVDFFDWEPNYGLNEIVTQSFSFKANKDLTNSLDMVSTAQLVNSVASYTA